MKPDPAAAEVVRRPRWLPGPPLWLAAYEDGKLYRRLFEANFGLRSRLGGGRPTSYELDKPGERIWRTGTRRPEFCCRTCNRSATGAPEEDRRRNCRWRIRQNAQGGTIEAGGAAGRVAGAAGEAGTRS